MKIQVVIEGKTYEVEYEAANEKASSPLSIESRVQSLVLPTSVAGEVAGSSGLDEAKLCRAPVAGIVSHIQVDVGQSVASGEILMVVEAMKMENNLAASGNAKVSRVKVKVGESVKRGQVVVEFE